MANLVEIQKKFGSGSKEYTDALEALTGISDDDGKPSEELLDTLRDMK